MKTIKAFWVGFCSDVFSLLVGIPIAYLIAYVLDHFLVLFAVFIFVYSIKIYIEHCIDWGDTVINLKNKKLEREK